MGFVCLWHSASQNLYSPSVGATQLQPNPQWITVREILTFKFGYSWWGQTFLRCRVRLSKPELHSGWWLHQCPDYQVSPTDKENFNLQKRGMCLIGGRSGGITALTKVSASWGCSRRLYVNPATATVIFSAFKPYPCFVEFTATHVDLKLFQDICQGML